MRIVRLEFYMAPRICFLQRNENISAGGRHAATEHGSHGKNGEENKAKCRVDAQHRRWVSELLSADCKRARHHSE